MKKNAALRLVDTRTLDRHQWLSVRPGQHRQFGCRCRRGRVSVQEPARTVDGEDRTNARGTGTSGYGQPTLLGTLLEPYVAAGLFAADRSQGAQGQCSPTTPTFPYMLANIDREVVGCVDVQISNARPRRRMGLEALAGWGS